MSQVLPTNARCHFRAMLPFRLERIPSCMDFRCPLLRIFPNEKRKCVISDEDNAKRGYVASEAQMFQLKLKCGFRVVSERRKKIKTIIGGICVRQTTLKTNAFEWNPALGL